MSATPRVAVAAMAVKVDGTDLDDKAYSDLVDVTVQDDLGKLSMFTLRFWTWDPRQHRLSWVDSDVFDLGAAVEIRMGYAGALETVIDAEVTSLELELTEEDMPVFVVQGCDRRHRLTRGTSTRVYSSMKDSDIAAQIARSQGLVPDVVDSGTVHASVLQHAQTDLAFLMERATAIGYEVGVEGKTLHFRPQQNTAKAAISLSTTEDLVRFQSRLTSRWQAGQVVVRAWDPSTKQAIVANASSSGVGSMGGTVGPAEVDAAFGQSTDECVDVPVASQQEADQLAQSRMGSMALDYVQGEGQCFGRTDLKAGVTADLQGLGQRFSGLYYVVSVAHTYSAEQGYRSTFSVKRNAS